MSRRAVEMLAMVAASLIMALIVAAAAVGLEGPPAAACLAAASTPCRPDSLDWCQPLNGRMICLGEPN